MTSDESKKVSLNGKEWEPLADGEYDAIVLGTGLKECMLGGLLCVGGKRVLTIDRNGYYGSESGSLNLKQLYERFEGREPTEREISVLGSSRDYNVDLVPKFLMACGNLVKILIHSKVTRYLEFKSVDGSYVFKGGKKKVFKVPATAMEAMKSSLIGFFQKRKLRNFLVFVEKCEEDSSVPGGLRAADGTDLSTVTSADLFKRFGLDANSQDFVGHSMALFRDDSYLTAPATECVAALRLYAYSLQRHGRSPYLYPIWGLSGLPEGFSRLAAVNGGIFMLNQDIERIEFDEGGRAIGVIAHGINEKGVECDMAASAPIIIGEPSYFPPEKVTATKKVIRTIAIFDHPVPNTTGESLQIIIPKSQIVAAGFPARNSDVYVSVISFAHCVAPRKPKPVYIAIVSTTVETSTPEREVEVGVRLLGPILKRFDCVSDIYEPVGDGSDDGCFISKSYDATSHFQSASADVLELYQRITGEELDMSIAADLSGEGK